MATPSLIPLISKATNNLAVGFASFPALVGTYFAVEKGDVERTWSRCINALLKLLVYLEKHSEPYQFPTIALDPRPPPE